MGNEAPVQLVIDTLTTLSPGAVAQLLPFAMMLMVTLFGIRAILEVGQQWIENPSPDWSLYFKLGLGLILSAIVVWGYPLIGWPLGEAVRTLGAEISGGTPVPLGQIARQADVITEAVDRAIDGLASFWSPIQTIKNLGLIFKLRMLELATYVGFIIIQLVALWIFCEFCIGFIVGGLVSGTLSWDVTRTLGWKGIMYVIGSALSLFAVTVVQGFSEVVMAGAFLPDGSIATVPALNKAMWAQGTMAVLAGSSFRVMRSFMSAYAGASGAPSANVARHAGSAGAGVSNVVSGNFGGGSGGGGMTGSAGGGGGSGGGFGGISMRPMGSYGSNPNAPTAGSAPAAQQQIGNFRGGRP